MKTEKVLKWKRSKSTNNVFLEIGRRVRVCVFQRAVDGRFGVNMLGMANPDTYETESEAIDAVHALLGF
jgi:hypothetical protein